MSGAVDGGLDDGALLGGRVRHRQFANGHRTGIEPVLLAAAVPAHPGERVLEGGTGSGAALLCLASRVPGVRGVGVERDPALAGLARSNVAENNFADISVAAGDLCAFRADAPFDHAFANPPWHDEQGTSSPDAARDAARRGRPGLLCDWAAALAAALRAGGTLTFILAAAVLPDCLAAFAGASAGGAAILPLSPRDGAPAKLVIVQARRGSRAPCRILPGLVLHQAGGRYTDATAAILSGGAALPL